MNTSRSAGNALPDRVVVGANGAYWREYDEGYSMCPVSEDNDPVEVVAVYVRLPPDGEREAHAWRWAYGVVGTWPGAYSAHELSDRAFALLGDLRAALAGQGAAHDHVRVGTWCYACVDHGITIALEGVQQAKSLRAAIADKPE